MLIQFWPVPSELSLKYFTQINTSVDSLIWNSYYKIFCKIELPQRPSVQIAIPFFSFVKYILILNPSTTFFHSQYHLEIEFSCMISYFLTLESARIYSSNASNKSRSMSIAWSRVTFTSFGTSAVTIAQSFSFSW